MASKKLCFLYWIALSLFSLGLVANAQNEQSNSPTPAPTVDDSGTLLKTWRTSIESEVEVARGYVVPTEAQVQTEKSRLARSCQSLQVWMTERPQWRGFLNFEALLKALSEPQLESIDLLLTEKLLCRWQVARDSVNSAVVGTLAQEIWEFNALLQQWKKKETSESRLDRLARLGMALTEFGIAPSLRTRRLLVRTALEMEGVGQAHSLCKEIRKEFLQPNLIIRGPERLFLPVNPEVIDDSFPTAGVYSGLQTSGSGNIKGAIQVSLVRSDAALEYEVTLRGNATTQSQGSNTRVRVQSTADSRLYAAKRGAIFGWARKSFGATLANAPTTINYGSIAPQGGRIARREIVGQVRSSTRSSELQAQEEMESSLRRQVDEAVEKSLRAADLTAVYRLRDSLLTTAPDRLGIGWKTFSDHVEIGIQCYNHTQEQFAGPPPLHKNSEAWMVAVHESLLSNALQRLLLDSKLGLQYVPAGGDSPSKGILVSAETGERVEIVFQKMAPVIATCLEGTIQTTMRVSSLTNGSTTFKDCRIEIEWKPSFAEGEVRLQRLDKVKVLPIDFDASKDRIKVRDLSAFRVLERALSNAVQKSQTMPLQIPDGLGKGSSEMELRTQNGWLVIESGT